MTASSAQSTRTAPLSWQRSFTYHLPQRIQAMLRVRAEAACVASAFEARRCPLVYVHAWIQLCTHSNGTQVVRSFCSADALVAKDDTAAAEYARHQSTCGLRQDEMDRYGRDTCARARARILDFACVCARVSVCRRLQVGRASSPAG